MKTKFFEFKKEYDVDVIGKLQAGSIKDFAKFLIDELPDAFIEKVFDIDVLNPFNEYYDEKIKSGDIKLSFYRKIKDLRERGKCIVELPGKFIDIKDEENK